MAGMQEDVQPVESSDPSVADSKTVLEFRIGQLVILQGRPCKIRRASRPKTDQHGNTERHFIGQDIFTKEHYQGSYPVLSTMNVPLVIHREYELIDILDSGFALLLYRHDGKSVVLRMPHGGLGVKIRVGFEDKTKTVLCTVMSSCGDQVIISTRSTENSTDTTPTPQQ